MLKQTAGVVAGALLACTAFAAAAASLGVFALQGGVPKTRAHLAAATVASNPLARKLDVWLTTRAGTAPLRLYTSDMTKLMHLVVVSDDLSQFIHLHPELDSSGHFHITASLPGPALYHFYADAEPRGFGQQVFRFDIPVGGGKAVGTRFVPPTGPTQVAGPYEVSLSSTSLQAGRTDVLDVHVLHDGRPATDLHPYLGAPAHAVFLNALDLSYVHVHPVPLTAANAADMAHMDMSHMNMSSHAPTASAASIASPDMRLLVDLHERGAYRMWLQFRGGTVLYVAPFTIEAK
jgi:hypothetical protein